MNGHNYEKYYFFGICNSILPVGSAIYPIYPLTASAARQ